jgi:hypothetical protein
LDRFFANAANRLARPLIIVKKLLRLAAYRLHNGLQVSVFLKKMLRRMATAWGSPSGSTYLREWYLEERPASARLTRDAYILRAPFFCGLDSGMALGHEPSQTVAEGLFSTIKASFSQQHHANALTFLRKLDITLSALARTPGPRNSLTAHGSELSAFPLPLTDPSADLLTGPGREVKILGVVRRHPTVQSLLRADEASGGMVVMRVRESLWVMPAWQPLRFVAYADAAALVRMRAARSEWTSN